MADLGNSVRVSVLLAEPDEQRLVTLDLPAASTVWQAVERSALLDGRSDLDPSLLGVALYGKQVDRDRELEDGDRVEILRPLQQDPKDRRRRLAREGSGPARRRGRG